MKGRLVGIDAGGTMTKVVLFDLAGNELGCERQSNRVIINAPNFLERHAEAMWQSVCESLKALLINTKTDPADILAVTPSGYGAGLYLVDKNGASTRNGIISADTRTLPLVKRWHEQGIASAIKPLIHADVWASQVLPLFAWLKEHEPDVMRKSAHFLGCKDFLRLRLCGDVSTDPTDAGCAGFIDVRTGKASIDALKAAGLSEFAHLLPNVKSPIEIAGHVSAAAAKATGLKAGTPVCRGVYDVVGCALSTGVQHESQLAAVAGTFSIHSTLHRAPTLDPLPTIQVVYPAGDYFMATMATPTSASNLEWFVRTFMAAEAQQAKAAGESVYERCNELVEGTMAHDNTIMFFPFLLGGPAGVPANFTGMTMGSSMADMLRAIYEGVACIHRFDMEHLLRGPSAAKPNVIRFAGGPSRSAVWSQMFCDTMGMPFEITNGNELGAKGAAMCGAVAVGAFSNLNEAMSKMVKVERRLTPDAKRAAVMSKKYQQFLSTIKRAAA